MTTRLTYTDHRTAYHATLGIFLLCGGAFGYFLMTNLTRLAENGVTPLILSYAPFVLPIGLLLAALPLVLEIMQRNSLYRLPEKGFLLLLVLMPIIFYGWMDFSKARFESWLTELDYERCAAMEPPSTLPHEVWVKKEGCL